jgi:hypothetical protein
MSLPSSGFIKTSGSKQVKEFTSLSALDNKIDSEI